MEILQRMIKKLSNDIVDMKISARESTSNQRPYRHFFKRPPPFKSIEPSLANLNIDLRDVALNSFYSYHKKNHFENNFPQ
jgi:hypothetical protein